jgi:hypothetical protein
MTTHLLRASLGLMCAAALATTGALAQSPAPAAARPAAVAAKPIPRLADGKPDFQGQWANATYTPLERPPALKDKEFFTQAEAEKYLKERVNDFEDQDDSVPHYDDVLWMLEGNRAKGLTGLRTSIITEPKDGRIPPMNEAGRKRAADRQASRKGIDPFESAQTRGISERCIYWQHEGPPILPTGYNSNLQIFQAPNTFVVIPEMMPVARIVPLSATPRIPATFQYNRGDSRGWWDGDTMVVETANFNDTRNWRNASNELKVTERYTMVDADTIRYEFTIVDPKTWDVPWKGEYLMHRFKEPIFEYACHEGNYGIVNILNGARAEEAARKKSGSN